MAQHEFVYIAGSEAWHTEEGLPYYKVGFTNDIDRRKVELFAHAAQPKPVEMLYSVPALSGVAVEQAIHRELRKVGVGFGKEFFREDLETIKKLVNRIALEAAEGEFKKMQELRDLLYEKSDPAELEGLSVAAEAERERLSVATEWLSVVVEAERERRSPAAAEADLAAKRAGDLQRRVKYAEVLKKLPGGSERARESVVDRNDVLDSYAPPKGAKEKQAQSATNPFKSEASFIARNNAKPLKIDRRRIIKRKPTS